MAKFTGPVTRLRISSGEIFVQIRNTATGQLEEYIIVGKFLGDAEIGERVKINMWFSLLREAFINRLNVTIDSPGPGLAIVEGVTLGGP
jgi:hypothetical protein